MLHCTSDMERISDRAVEICISLEELLNQNLTFSNKAKKELGVLVEGVYQIVNMTSQAYLEDNLDLAREIEPLEEVIDSLNVTLRQRHIDRLRNGKCTIELGIILEDIITNLERIADHCSNIAVCMIQVNSGSFDTHEYMEDHMKKSPWFYERVKVYSEMFSLKNKGKEE